MLQFERGMGGDIINFSDIAEIDVRVAGSNIRLRVANPNFGTGQLLVTIRGVNDLMLADVGQNLTGSMFNFEL